MGCFLDGPLGPFAIPLTPELTNEHARIMCEGVWAGEYDAIGLPTLEAPRVLDIGAHCGAFAVWIRKKWPNARVACFEPNSGACPYVRINAPFAAVHNVAITSDPNATYHLPPDWGSARTLGVEGGAAVRKLHPANLPSADVLKVDAEGVEVDVLENYAHWPDLKVVMYEYHPWPTGAHARLRAIAASHGFINLREEAGYSGASIWIRSDQRKEPSVSDLNFSIAVMAVHRDGANFHSTLASALLADRTVGDHPIHLVLDSAVDGQAAMNRHLYNVHLLDNEQDTMQYSRTGGTRSLLTLERALATANDDGVLILEDDLSFSVDWLQRTKTLLKSVEGKRCLLYLYWHGDPLSGGSLVELNADQWGYASLGVYFSKGLAEEFSARLREWDPDERNSNKITFSGNAFIANWARWLGAPILVANPNLIQHQGNTVGIGTVVGVRQSKMFDESRHPRLVDSPIVLPPRPDKKKVEPTKPALPEIALAPAVPHVFEQVKGTFMFPEFYRWIVEEEARRVYAEFGRRLHFVEVGVYLGQSAAFIAVEATRLAPEVAPIIDLVEPSMNRAMPGLTLVRPLLGALHAMFSVDGARQYPDGSLDVVYIDAAHDYDNVKADIAAWWPKVRPGGILSGHDYAVGHPGVVQAVVEAFGEFMVVRGSKWSLDKWGIVHPGEELYEKGDYTPSWWVRKGVDQ